ncbi:MAG: hypothetical protein AB1646_23955 [Thermodesulfobacteriota bacterium]
MSEVLEIRLIMNSAMEEVLAFKTCCGLKMFDQNLEILIRNRGEASVTIPSRFLLEGEGWSKKVDTVMPPGERCLGPGEIMALYCEMEDTLWARARRLVLCDASGATHAVDIADQPRQESGSDQGRISLLPGDIDPGMHG